jgi:hypothetical protein
MECTTYKWRVVPLCEKQLLDVSKKDIIADGVFRLCDVYKSGGGYDKFPQIYERRYGVKTKPKQFVVQLYGCHLACPYCYVTQKGIWGDYIEFTSKELVEEFIKHDCDVFHLMGGSPEMYIEFWPELIDMLANYGQYIFHSDLTLTHHSLNRYLLQAISQERCLYAVNVKGVTPEDYKRNTNREFNSSMFWLNLYHMCVAKVPFYMTFTNPDIGNYGKFINHIINTLGYEALKDSFIIDLIEYDALKEEINECT